MAPPDPDDPLSAPYRDADFLRALLEAIPAFVGCLDGEMRMRYLNQFAHGFSADNVLGRSTFDFVAPEHHALHRRSLEEALAGGGPARHVVKGDGPDGTSVYYQSMVTALSHPTMGKLACVLSTDVTEHVARAEALRVSEEKLRITVEATGIGLWSWDPVHNTVEWSERILEITGLTVPPTPEEYIAKVVHPDDREPLAVQLRGARAGGAPAFIPHRIVRPDGEVRWILPLGQKLTTEGGQTRLRGGVLDITAERQVEERLRVAQKMEAIGGLTAGVAHNFNNMLAIILPSLESLRRGAGGRELTILEDALHAARRAAELVAQLMTFAPRPPERRRGVIDLVPVVAHAVSMSRRTFDAGIEIALTHVPEAHAVASAHELEQVLINLLINSRDALEAGLPSHPRIAIDVDVPAGAGMARVRVSDNGAGMTAEVQRRIFEPFFTTKVQGRGTGLGLSVSYAIVREHGGRIELQSSPGKGTTFSLLLPLADPPRARAPTPAPVARPSPRVTGAILLIDDADLVCSTVGFFLREHGHRVTAFTDVEPALKALDGGLQIDLVLLDRSLPGWTPAGAVAELRVRRPTVPIVFFTGLPPPEEEERLVEAVLLKPVPLEELLGAIEPWLARK